MNNYPRYINNIAHHNLSVRNSIGEDLNKTCLIFGNGPSCANARPPIDNVFICRTNWFFLEDEPKFGDIVDAYFCGVYNQEMLSQLMHSKYKIKRLFAPFNLFEKKTINEYLYRKDIKEKYNHWAVISEKYRIAREFIKRPLPTQGIQMIAFAAILGFSKIEVYGIDFYSDVNQRYFYNQNKKSLEALEEKDLTPGYEANHSIETDKTLLKIIEEEFPETIINFN